MEEIIIEVSGGVVQSVSNIPKGVRVIIRDYDNKTEEEECSEDIWEEFVTVKQ
jgi:hypothetical protein